jgi:hypothetical protein
MQKPQNSEKLSKKQYKPIGAALQGLRGFLLVLF